MIELFKRKEQNELEYFNLSELWSGLKIKMSY